MEATLKVDPEKKKKYLAYAKETVYWEACLEKGERLEQKVTFVHICLRAILTLKSFIGSMEEVQGALGSWSHIPWMDLLCDDSLPNISL